MLPGVPAAYPENLEFLDLYLATMEMTAHLDYLVLKGKARAVSRLPIRKFVKT